MHSTRNDKPAKPMAPHSSINTKKKTKKPVSSLLQPSYQKPSMAQNITPKSSTNSIKLSAVGTVKSKNKTSQGMGLTKHSNSTMAASYVGAANKKTVKKADKTMS